MALSRLQFTGHSSIVSVRRSGSPSRSLTRFKNPRDHCVAHRGAFFFRSVLEYVVFDVFRSFEDVQMAFIELL
jgi:hypothetical protein